MKQNNRNYNSLQSYTKKSVRFQLFFAPREFDLQRTGIVKSSFGRGLLQGCQIKSLSLS